ncbi:hypothetical protein HPB49_002759 [Dermacentor silvarum]|uniref:Uncharacterized protein n=1 Tax=Dermacentor silvarum TaxID=543639 RepID=A0ACB8D9V6_DERSI|nr:hypothetical protein HPB49_002759 [Dermacentor silvarum]
MGLLPFRSAHSKLIKRGVASAALGNALQRSCYHQVHTSFCSQVEKLLSAGYPRPLLTGVAEKLLEKCAKLSPLKTAAEADGSYIRVCDRLFAYVSAFLSGRSFRVRVGGSTSSPRSISVSVPQGSVLSPFLFNSALARLPDFIPRTLPSDVRLAIYADDLALISVGPTSSGRLVRQSIQGAINAIDSYLTGIGLNLSTTKTEALLVHPQFRGRYQVPRLNLRGVLIPWSRRVRYLRVLIDHRLSWKPAVAALRTGSTKVANAARSLHARGRGCSPQLALRVYNAVATSRCLYGLPLASLTPSQWKTLDMQQRQVIRQLYGLPRNSPIGPTLAEAKDFPLSVRAQWRALNHVERLQRTRQGQYLVLRLHSLPHSCMGRRAAEFHTLVPTPYCG